MNVKELEALCKAQGEKIEELCAKCDAQGKILDDLQVVVASLSDVVDEVRERGMGRNKSSSTKRDMTSADALRVMTGDLKDLSHKDAAERAGLTYAQVYSARGEFTFKHVHADLRKQGWKNPWARD